MSHSHDHNGKVEYLTVKQIITHWWRKKTFKFLPTSKQPITDPTRPPQPPYGMEINTIAVVLDGRVEEVLRAQNRLAALFLSNPQFITFEPEETPVKIGWTYEDNKFIAPEEEHNHEQKN